MLDVECSLFQGRVPLQKIKQLSLPKVFVWLRSYFHRSRSQTLIMEKKTVCLISQYLIGHEVKHSSLHEEKIKPLKYKIPFLETQIVPHLLYWA